MKPLETVHWGILGCGAVCERKSGPPMYRLDHSQLVAVMRRDEANKADDAHKGHGHRRQQGTDAHTGQQHLPGLDTQTFGQRGAASHGVVIPAMQEEKNKCCQQQNSQAKCLVLIYEGPDAISKIRSVLGPTDPSKAPGGTVRRDFGSNIMVNTAHASDSPESVEREMKIIRIQQNSLSARIYEFLAESSIDR